MQRRRDGAMQSLRYGDTGPLVYLLQRTLFREGYDVEVNGRFDLRTQEAVRIFQRSLDIPDTGEVTTPTWQALLPALTGFTTYRVLPGDTFYKIARRFGVPLYSILAANPDVDPDNLQVGDAIVLPLPGEVVITDIPYSYDILRLNLYALRARYPFLQASSAGRSVRGRQIVALQLGKGNTHTFYNASHHANEWITTPVLMRFVEQLCIAATSEREIFGQPAVRLLSEHMLHFIPMVNPDGVDLVTGAIPPGSPDYVAAQAMNTEGLRFPEDWKANIRGVDLNLNYPAGWERAKEIEFALGHTQPGPRDYVGPSPLSEPETQTVAGYTRKHNFDLTLSYHAQGEVIYWKFEDYHPPGAYEIGQAMSKASGYALDTPPQDAAYAGYKDWFIQEYNKPGYTVEAGKGVNPLPLSQFEEIYQNNIGILTLGATLAGKEPAPQTQT